jgi:signal transduction histidine kinase
MTSTWVAVAARVRGDVFVPKDQQGDVLEPFYTTKAVGKGTGLGLSKVYGFVKQSGGHVEIYSEMRQGTTVKLFLPMLTGASAEPETLEMMPGGGLEETILVVEDDDDVRTHSVGALCELG